MVTLSKKCKATKRRNGQQQRENVFWETVGNDWLTTFGRLRFDMVCFLATGKYEMKNNSALLWKKKCNFFRVRLNIFHQLLHLQNWGRNTKHWGLKFWIAVDGRHSWRLVDVWLGDRLILRGRKGRKMTIATGRAALCLFTQEPYGNISRQLQFPALN